MSQKGSWRITKIWYMKRVEGQITAAKSRKQTKCPAVRDFCGCLTICFIYTGTCKYYDEFRIFKRVIQRRHNNKSAGTRHLLGAFLIKQLCNVFEPRTDTGSVLFSYFTCLHTTTFIFLSFFALVETITLKIWERSMSWPAKCLLPVAVRGSKTLHA